MRRSGCESDELCGRGIVVRPRSTCGPAGRPGTARTPNDCRKQWNLFGQARRGSSVTIDDLFDWAEGCGWSSRQESRSRVDGPQAAWGLAEQFIETTCLSFEGNTAVRTLRYYRGEFYRWRSGRYVPVPLGEIRNAVVGFLGPMGLSVMPMVIAAVLDSLRVQTEVAAEKDAPCWLDDDLELLGEIVEPPAAPEDVIATRNGLVDVRAFLDGRPRLLPATPKFFCTAAVDFEFAAKGKKPTRWLTFLKELWPNDQASVETLQEWAGYVVMRRTELQKILMVLGPPRAGKGTIAKVLTALASPASTAAPKLSDFAQQFGLAPLIDKTLAIIPDARLSNRHDQATIVERLLSISGEDCVTIDRKHRDPITVKLATRITLFTNELPSWDDTAGALASRLIVLHLTRSFISPDGADSNDEVGQDDCASLPTRTSGSSYNVSCRPFCGGPSKAGSDYNSAGTSCSPSRVGPCLSRRRTSRPRSMCSFAMSARLVRASKS